MNYSVNQVRHLYVVSTVNSNLASVGAICPYKTDDGKQLYFKYVGADGVIRSDLIDIDKICSYKQIKHTVLQPLLKKAVVTLDSNVNGGLPVAGLDYILRIYIRQFAGMSDEDVYVKYGAVHAYAGMTAANFYNELAKSLTKNFSREATKLLTFSASANGVTITEVPQDWVRGVKAQVPVVFDVVPTTIIVSGDTVQWGKTIEYKDMEKASALPNGKKIADLEYFCMGERGDIYRNVGWPNVIPTKYLVDDTEDYDIVEMHYYYEGGGENPQKSEKDITFAIKSGTSPSVTSALIAGIKTFTNLTPQKITPVGEGPND